MTGRVATAAYTRGPSLRDGTMKLRMAENSLFAVLLRSPWWASAAVGAAVAGVAALALPSAYVPYGVFGAAPFAVIALMAGWRQLRTPSASRVDEKLESVRAMPWNEFSTLVERTLQSDGSSVQRIGVQGAEFEAVKDGRRTLVHCKRWKVARTGVGPLRELDAEVRARDAAGAIYVAAGDVTDQARTFATQRRIQLLEGRALAQWLRAPASSGGKPRRGRVAL
jgi:restriction system protein